MYSQKCHQSGHKNILSFRALPLVLLLFLIFSSGCSIPPFHRDLPSVSPETLIDLSGRPIAEDVLIAQLQNADFILIGESHTNPCDHRVQNRLIQLCHNNGLSFVVGMEMIPAAKNQALKQYNSGDLSPEELRNTLDWRCIWGHDFALYKPVLRTIQQAGYSLYGLNVRPGLIRALREKGCSGLSQEEKENMPEDIIPVPKAQTQSLRKQFKAHQQFMVTPKTKADEKRFFLVQSLWDTQMAIQAIKLHGQTKLPVIILCGTGHVQYGWGIAHRLNILAPSTSILSIIPWRKEECPETKAADIFYFCPAQHRSRLGFTMEFKARGVEIVQVFKGSRAAQAGLQQGDILREVGDEPFNEIMDLHHAAIQAMQSSQPLALTIERDGQKLSLNLNLQRPKRCPDEL